MHSVKKIIETFLLENPEILSIIWENDIVYATFILKPEKQFNLSHFNEGTPTYRLLQRLTQHIKKAENNERED